MTLVSPALKLDLHIGWMRPVRAQFRKPYVRSWKEIPMKSVIA